MTRPARIAIAVLSTLLAIVLALMIWRAVTDRASAKVWAAKDAERVAFIDDLVASAQLKHKAAMASLAAADERHAGERAELEDDLKDARRRRQNRPVPADLESCHTQLAQADADAAVYERAASVDLLTIANLRTAFEDEEDRGDLLEDAWLQEREQSTGWREYSRKQKRRQKVKLAFIGIGSGVGGGLVGYGIGVSR
jgi:hypothetical protein